MAQWAMMILTKAGHRWAMSALLAVTRCLNHISTMRWLFFNNRSPLLYKVLAHLWSRTHMRQSQ
eukprot:7466194-Karenia_brevis.AAC.1